MRSIKSGRGVYGAMDPDLSIRVRLPDGAEVELRGDQAGIERTLNELQGIVSKVYSAFHEMKPSQLSSNRSDNEPDVLEEYPTIERPSGSQDGILKILTTDWGKAKPRSWKEIHAGLSHNAVHLSGGSVTGALTLMLQAGKLRRVKLGDTYAYTLPLSAK